MNYERPTLELMGQMDELTGSCGTQLIGDMYSRCVHLTWQRDWDSNETYPVCLDDND